jgi:hypothetical protein
MYGYKLFATLSLLVRLMNANLTKNTVKETHLKLQSMILHRRGAKSTSNQLGPLTARLRFNNRRPSPPIQRRPRNNPHQKQPHVILPNDQRIITDYSSGWPKWPQERKSRRNRAEFFSGELEALHGMTEVFFILKKFNSKFFTFWSSQIWVSIRIRISQQAWIRIRIQIRRIRIHSTCEGYPILPMLPCA